MKRNISINLAAALCCAASTGLADFAIDVDLSADPIKDVRTSTCGPEVGYAGCFMQIKGWYGTDAGEEYWFRDHAAETSRAMREAGAWFQRMWDANAWFARRVPDTKPDPKKRYTQSHPDIAFKFWKDNGFKVLFTLEAWGHERSKKEIIELIDYIVANHYEDVVAGFELGNESYYSKDYASLAPIWCEIIPEIRKRMPKVKLGINLAELFELNPDITQVRNRMLAAGEIKRDTYFAAGDFNRYSAQFVTAMSNCINQITHVIYHAYGAETPYSCSYYGFQRFRNFMQAFPELKDKKMWLSEVRPRSDEDNYCQRMFREALIMAHYSMMAICQPEMDGFNHHQIYALSGGIYQSDGKTWQVQWRDTGREYNDWRAPMGQPRLEVGACGVMYRILAEAIKEHPLILRHGTSKGRYVLHLGPRHGSGVRPPPRAQGGQERLEASEGRGRGGMGRARRRTSRGNVSPDGEHQVRTGGGDDHRARQGQGRSQGQDLRRADVPHVELPREVPRLPRSSWRGPSLDATQLGGDAVRLRHNPDGGLRGHEARRIHAHGRNRPAHGAVRDRPHPQRSRKQVTP